MRRLGNVPWLRGIWGPKRLSLVGLSVFGPISYNLDGSSIVAFNADVNVSVMVRDKMGILLSTLSLKVRLVIVGNAGL